MIRGLSQYRLLCRLGQGGQGDVYLAFDTRLKRRVCIKLYHLDRSLSARRRAVREARHLMEVSSPQTVVIYDVVSVGSQLAMVMQYVPGGTLKELLATSPRVSPANALAIVTDLAAALAALRRAKLVHGDLKAANVLIGGQGRAVLSDFGASIFAGEQWSAYSRESLSPEQSRGEPAALVSDFFALGLLLYRMLFGAHPFYAGGVLDMQRLRGGLKTAPDIPSVASAAEEALKALLLSLLSSNPEDRPQGTFELRENLRRIRSLLPASTLADLPVDSLSKGIPENSGNIRLPRKLLRPPLWDRLKAGLSYFWFRGTWGARGLLLGTAATPILLLTLVWLAPGPCVAVALPQINVGPDGRRMNAGEGELHALLTALLKQNARRAVVLGAGEDSDSRYTLSKAGAHNQCIAKRQLYLQLDCDEGRCLIQLEGLREDEVRERQLFVPQTASRFELTWALKQLLEEQLDFLLY